jgi:formylglycine-generating enzyme required for sulfatase activity
MRLAALACLGLSCLASCDYPPLPRLGLPGHGDDAGIDDVPPPGVVSLRASPSVFILHQNDTRETTLTLSNGTGDAIAVPSQFTVSGLVGGTLTFSGNTCGPQLSAGASCSAIGNLVANTTVQTTFDVSLGATSARLSMTAMPACPASCGIFGQANCCASTIVPGNAASATLAGQVFHRDHDNAPDAMYPSTDATAAVSDFRLDTYEVTVGRFRAFLNAGMGTAGTAPGQGAGAHARIPGSGWDPTWSPSMKGTTAEIMVALKCDPSKPGDTWTDMPGAGDGAPINCLTWYEAMAFCTWDGGYLPTEAEWNYAASGGNAQRPYPWSESDSSTTIGCSFANYGIQNCHVSPIGVGNDSPAGDGRWGHTDLAGNTAEWTLDWYSGSYPTECKDCANLTPGTDRAIRGGGFNEPAASLRVGSRVHETSLRRKTNLGVRCARTP